MRPSYLLVLIPLISSVAYAQDAADTPPATIEAPVVTPATEVIDTGPLPIEFHGYASQGYAISDHNNYYLSNTNRGTFRLTDAALNAAAQVTDKLRIVMQVAAVINDNTPQPQLRIDFGFADYHWSDKLGFRAGRYRLLQSLYSEVWDTDIARVPIFLPGGVYSPLGRQLYLESNGVEAYGTLSSESAGSINYVLDAGVLDTYLSNGQTQDMRWIVNTRIIYDTPLNGLRFGGSYSRLGATSVTSLDPATSQQVVAAGLVPPTFDGNISLRYHNLWATKAFIEYSISRLTLVAEYQFVWSHLISNAQALAPNIVVRDEGFYGMATYRWTDWFTTGAYASFYYPDNKHRTTDPSRHQFDYALTMRFDINAYLAFKLEGHRIDGNAQLAKNLNTGTQTEDGWLFAARASAAF
jgi:hypothetical protein